MDWWPEKNTGLATFMYTKKNVAMYLINLIVDGIRGMIIIYTPIMYPINLIDEGISTFFRRETIRLRDELHVCVRAFDLD